MRVSLTGDTIAQLLSVSGDSVGAFKAGHSYDLVRVHLIRVGCPREMQASAENRLNVPIVIEKNRKHYGEIVATGYYPEAVVVAGAYRRNHMIAHGVLDAMAWVERGAIEINADDAIGCGELTEKLSHLIQVKIYGNNQPITGQPWPYIVQVYPFENYLIYEFGGQKFRQAFALDPTGRNVALSGDSVKVQEKFVDACGSGMPRTQDGMRQVKNPLPLAGNQVSSRGGENSDLVRMVIRNTANVDKVVAKLLAAIKNGLYKPLQPDFYPVNLSDAGKILGPLVEAGISPVDFVAWADENGGEFMEFRDFSDKTRKKMAKTGAAMKNGGFPIQNRQDVRNAVRSIGRAKNPAATKTHIIKHAKKLGVLDELPKQWKAADMKAWGKTSHTHHTTGHNHAKMHDSGSQKKASFKV
jgi:hypothetical protein